LRNKQFMTVGCGMLVLGTIFSVNPVNGDEGMWLIDNPPTELLAKKYGFTPSADWFEHVQKSCVKFGQGGSASIVSDRGLVMTNHHVGFSQLQKLSTPARNLLEVGFLARTTDEELRCSDLELRVLWKIDDVTQDVESVATANMSASDSNDARRKKIANIEKDARDRTGLDCQVVMLFRGAKYHLYQYKRFTDIRLVMAPEGGIAHFGGDTDNFEYPRYCLDVSFFRIYENGEPLRPEHFLKWSGDGASDGDLSLIVGHPARTERLLTMDALAFLRDVKVPTILRRLWRREVQLQVFSARNDEYARMARSSLGRVQNSRKAFTGILAGLLDPQLMAKKAEAESQLRNTVNANDDYRTRWGDSWDRIADAQTTHAQIYERYTSLSGRRGVLRSRLFGIARNLVRLAEEKTKPNDERLEEFQEAALDSMYLRLYSPAPIYKELEIDGLTSGLSYLAETFGDEDPLVNTALHGQSPRDRAETLVRETQLADVAYRKQLAESGLPAVRDSRDPMIRLAWSLDGVTRELRKRYEDEVQSVERDAYANIASARFAILGDSIYPDATFSLRLAFGPIVGYNEGQSTVPAFTHFTGLFERARKRGSHPHFNLPESWLGAKDSLDLTTPFNFVSTADIIGGNSGSPVINRSAEVIGIVFDGNIHSLVWDIGYSDRQARAVSVDSRAIIEGLRKVYKANELVNELTGS
jgi:Peptidase S46